MMNMTIDLDYTEDMRNVKTNTIIKFLRSKGWTLGKQTVSDQFMLPPIEMRGSDDTYLAIPLEKYEKAEDYPLVINLVLNTISVLYNRKKEDLVKFFSKTLEEIKEETEVGQKMIELQD